MSCVKLLDAFLQQLQIIKEGSSVRLIIALALLSLSVSALQQRPAIQPVTVEASAQATPTPTPRPLPQPNISIEEYRATAGRIIGAALTSKNAHNRLGYLTGHIGNRLSGSKNLERASEWAIGEMKKDGLDNVRAEKVMVPHWVRGDESLEIVSPVTTKLAMLGLGNSIATPAEGITAEVVVVRTFDELDALGERVRGKIVVYNAPFTNYGTTVRYRGSGASRAGAVAALSVQSHP
jgi:carboxypeptidase Q